MSKVFLKTSGVFLVEIYELPDHHILCGDYFAATFLLMREEGGTVMEKVSDDAISAKRRVVGFAGKSVLFSLRMTIGLIRRTIYYVMLSFRHWIKWILHFGILFASFCFVASWIGYPKGNMILAGLSLITLTTVSWLYDRILFWLSCDEVTILDE